MLLWKGRRAITAGRNSCSSTMEDFPSNVRLPNANGAALDTRPLEYDDVHLNLSAKNINCNQDTGMTDLICLVKLHFVIHVLLYNLILWTAQ